MNIYLFPGYTHAMMLEGSATVSVLKCCSIWQRRCYLLMVISCKLLFPDFFAGAFCDIRVRQGMKRGTACSYSQRD